VDRDRAERLEELFDRGLSLDPAERRCLEVALETDGRGLVRQLDRSQNLPRPVSSRVSAPAGVVRGEASADIVGEANVGTMRLRHTLKNVDDMFGWHTVKSCKAVTDRVIRVLLTDPDLAVSLRSESA
jgi:hypothetical protein